MKGPLVLLFGEDANDRAALKRLILGLRTDLAPGNVRELREPLTLVKNLNAAKKKSRAAKLAAVVRAEKMARQVSSVVIHEDADAVEPAHMAAIHDIRTTYAAVPAKVIPIVPAWEMESWWFLFPKAVAKVNARWASLNSYKGRNVGVISNSKEELRRALRPKGKGASAVRDYHEKDSPAIAGYIVELGLISAPQGTSASWAWLIQQAPNM